ncbi:hypothetical protein OJF2_64740 [Aquisphaera giovannonii]|uniref:Uncharacterized protein n=1 Tax=Aquisphaera giovannonii TaxID=406548 RepID=A0A5B9WBE3_9BACT|nr:Imm21 family immunity protein [Aquisphaera giovannonii]QEH37882.1 hypothetical protein OJF2_64740 [Aquisphaera giovannonii]
MKDGLTWVGTNGGPLIVIPGEIAPRWRGGDDTDYSLKDLDRWWETLDAGSSDYGRACGIREVVGMLAVGPGRALILRKASMPTAFVPREDGGILVRGIYAEEEATLRRALCTMPESAWKPTPHRITVSREGLLVFDSAQPGDHLPTSMDEEETIPCLRLGLHAGTYHVDTADHSPVKTNRLCLHRLRREWTSAA